MSARGSSIGANDLTRAPHHAPYSKHIRRDFDYPTAEFQVGRRGGRLSESSPAAAGWATSSVQGERPSRNFFSQFLIDVLAVLVAFTLIIATGLALGFAVFALMFLSF